MKLYFENSWGERRLIGEPETIIEGQAIIRQFCAERNYEIPYFRWWVEGNEVCVDTGSHSEFFYYQNDDGSPIELPT